MAVMAYPIVRKSSIDLVTGKRRTGPDLKGTKVRLAKWHQTRKARPGFKVYKKSIEKARRSRISNTDAYKKATRKRSLKARYGLTPELYDKVLEFQKGVCAICGNSPVNRRLNTDHQHVKGFYKLSADEKIAFVRGLLCWYCNQGLGWFKDSIKSLHAATGYLADPPARKILGTPPRG